MERVVASALYSPAMERLAAQLIESRPLDRPVERLLKSDGLAKASAFKHAVGRARIRVRGPLRDR